MNFKISVSVILIGISLALLLFLAGNPLFPVDETNYHDSSEYVFPEFKVMETNGVKHIISLDKIKAGGPPKDGIPSIDNPIFAPSSESHLMSGSDVVIGVEINGEAKAYPLFILVWHEIVNDTVGGVPVSVTYCPLCYTSQVFERVIGTEVVEFGTSGKLYNSNLLMYDRLTGSYWSQSLGIAVKGELAGQKLKILPFDVISWDDWKKLHPDTVVMTSDTGFVRSYSTDPYSNYYTESRIMFPVENNDDRMHPKEVILGFGHEGTYKAFSQNHIEQNILVNDFVGALPLLLVSFFPENTRAFDRTVMVGSHEQILDFEYVDGKITDSQTNSEWDYAGLAIHGNLTGIQMNRLPIEPGFWFEWVAFHPNTLIYGGS